MERYETILAIESSCDETAAAVIRGGREVLSNVISSQVPIHKIYGGVVPEIASRKHIEAADGVILQALEDAGLTMEEIDAVAVTYGPGLVGALLVGLSEAKGLAYAAHKPLLGVHHLKGHIAANYITNKEWEPPFLCLVVSGGHTHIIMVDDYANYRILGKTRDDAAGEAFDKVARAIGLGYPGGPKIQKAAEQGDSEAIHFPRPCLEEEGYNFSFSGLKSAVLNYLNQQQMMGLPVNQSDVAASFQAAVVEVLTAKVMQAARDYKVKRVAMAGGVSANKALRESLEKACREAGMDFCRPEIILCTDNAAMIGCAAYYEYEKGQSSPLDLNAYPNLTL
ncbi:MAG: tRNA (adenosine(37)-N6)-threonylcarbamoyltransferase complex transferase subunit TsaD [Lachnospiraceae bacterium]|nr:tRNA (adenosine(37)-N6)-threonylcarbamoyltransferase complex transferase subunit TsaD [Lachnospiraceae bacterium]